MKKEWTTKQAVLLFMGISFLLFAWCNLLPPAAGMGGADYFQIASGGYLLNSSNGCQTYFTSIPWENGYTGSMNWILRPLSLVFSGFDVRVLGTVYFLLTLLAFGYFLAKLPVEKSWHKLLIGGVSIVFFCDFAYLLHLNSFNPEGAFYCAILVMVSLLISQFHTKPGIIRTVCYLALAFFVAGVKTGYFWLGICLAVCLLPTLLVRKELWYRIITWVLVIGVSIGCVACFGNGVSYQEEQTNLFHSTYYGVLKDNDDATALQQLGISPNGAAYIGKTIYDVDSSVLDDGTLMPDYGDIVSYYLTHPSQLWQKLERSADNGYEIRQPYISNYPEYHQLKYGFNGYSALKRRFIQPDFWFVLVFLAAVMIYCALQLKKQPTDASKAHHLFLILLCLLTLVTFVTPVMISGEAALGAELYLYNLLFDVVFCHVVIGGTLVLLKRRENIQKKYGVQQ